MLRLVYVNRMLKPILPRFIEMRRADLIEMTNAINQSDFNYFRDLSHRLLGTPGTFGFHYLVKLAKLIEIAALNRDLDQLKKIKNKYEYFLKSHKVIFIP